MSGGRWRRALGRWHERWLGTGVGERTLTVLHGIGWVTGGALVCRVLTGVTTLLAARWLGAGPWGSVALALAASTWLQVTLFIGLPAALLNAVPRAEEAERREWVRTGMLLLGLAAILTLALGGALREPLGGLLGVGQRELIMALAWCGGFAVHAAACAGLAALERFRERTLVEVGFAVAFPVGVFTLRAFDALTWDRHVLAMAVAYLVVGVLAFGLARLPLPTWSPGAVARARTLLGFAVLAVSASVAIALINATARFVMDGLLPLAEVGVLAAYQGGSLQFALPLQGLLTVVFFPVASRTPDRLALRRKVVRLLLPLTVAASAAFALLLWAWIVLLGREFPLEAGPLAAFAVAAGTTVSFGFASWLLASGGRRGAAAASVTWLTCGGVNAAACLLLVPGLGTVGAGLAAVAGNAAGIATTFVPALRRLAGLAEPERP